MEPLGFPFKGTIGFPFKGTQGFPFKETLGFPFKGTPSSGQDHALEEFATSGTSEASCKDAVDIRRNI